MLRNLLVAAFILVGLSFTMKATTHMSIDGGDPVGPCSSLLEPISTGVNSVAANGDCDPDVFNFVNNFTDIIIGFTFSTTVLPELSSSDFTCSTGYFQDCQIKYDSSDGALEYIFSGTVTPTTFINCCTDGGPNGDEGIAPGAVFNITLTGWTVQSGLYSNDMENTPGGPQPFVNTVSIIPEPTAFASVLIGFLLLIGLGMRQRLASLAGRIGSWRVAKFAMALAICTVACSASPIFYLVNQTVGAGNVTGSIETDGSTGLISGANILFWNLLLNDGSTNYDIQGGPDATDPNSSLLVVGGDLSATPTQLLFNFSGTDLGVVLFEANAVGLETPFWCAADDTLCSGPSRGETLETADGIQFSSVSGTQVIAANPEPSTIAFAVAGLLGIFLIRRRFVKKAA